MICFVGHYSSVWWNCICYIWSHCRTMDVVPVLWCGRTSLGSGEYFFLKAVL